MTDNTNSTGETLGDSLRNVVDLDMEAAQHLRKRFLEEVDIPDGVEVEYDDPELQEGSVDNWTILFLWPNDDDYIMVEVLEGSHYIQVYSEDDGYSEPTYSPSDIEKAIKERVK